MKKPFVPYRWAELLTLNEVVTFLELDRMPAFGFTGAILWSSFMNHGLDSYYYTLPLVYRRFAEFNAVRDQDRIGEGVAFLEEFIRRAHRKNLTVMHAYNICHFTGGPPVGVRSREEGPVDLIRKVHPDWINEHGEPDYAQDVWYDFMAAEVEDFFERFPALDGLFCWNCENSQFTPSRLTHQTVPRREIVRRATKVVYDVCRRRGKLMTHDIHSGGAVREHTEHIIAAAAECPELILGADCTYSDWQLFLPTTPWLDQMRAHNRIYVGFDSSGEYFGKGKVLGVWPNWIIRHFMDAKEFGLTGITTRTEIWATGTSAFASPFLELNVRTVTKLALEGKIDLDRELGKWWHDHFDGPWGPGLKELIRRLEALQEKVLHVNHSGVSNSSISFPRSIFVGKGKVTFFEQFAEPGSRLDPEVHKMIPEEGMTVKPFRFLRQEKLDGMAWCDDAVAKLKGLALPAETHHLLENRLRQAKDVAQAQLYHIEAAHALSQQLGPYRDPLPANPKAALREALGHIRAHADDMDARWGTCFYDGFTGAMRQFAASVPPEYGDGGNESTQFSPIVPPSRGPA